MKPTQEREEISKLETLLAGEAAERQTLEWRLREYEERFEAFFASKPVGLAILDARLRYVRINETLAAMNGRTAEEHLGKTVSEVVPDLAPEVESALREIVRTRRPVLNLEVSGPTPAAPGHERRWLLSFVPLPAADGAEVVGALVYEMTDRQQLQAALKETEAKYRTLFEHASDVVLVFDEEGNFLEVNPKVFGLLGYTRDEFMRLNVRDLVPEEDLAAVPLAYDDLRAGRVVRRRRRLRRKDGTLVQVEVIGSMIGEGRMQSIVRDLSGGAHGARRAASSPAPAGDGAAQPTKARGGQVETLKELARALSAAVELLDDSQSEPDSAQFDLGRGIEFYEEVSRFEVNLIRRALRLARGRQKQAAALLGINPSTLHAMMKRYGLGLAEAREPAPALPAGPARED